MDLEAILNMLRNKPFVPFVIRLTNNSVYTITHPEMVMPVHQSLIVAIPGNGLPEGVYGGSTIVSQFHVAELIPIIKEVDPKSSTNGSN